MAMAMETETETDTSKIDAMAGGSHGKEKER